MHWVSHEPYQMVTDSQEIAGSWTARGLKVVRADEFLTEPLIWTSRGNVPASSLTYAHGWQETEKELIFTETWHFEDGELAKNNCHMYVKRGQVIGSTQAAMA